MRKEAGSRKPEAGPPAKARGGKSPARGPRSRTALVYTTTEPIDNVLRDAVLPARPVIRSYRDIEAFQRTMAIMAPLHRLIRRLPAEERYELASQLRRSSKSIAANIAEGYAKKRSAEHFRTYIDHAQGSANETVVHLEIAVAVGYLTAAEVQPIIDELGVIARQLYRLGETWRNFNATTKRSPASGVRRPASNIKEDR